MIKRPSYHERNRGWLKSYSSNHEEIFLPTSIDSIDIKEGRILEKYTNSQKMRKMYMYIQSETFMANTKLFKNGNSQAVRIPAQLAYSKWDLDLIIERHGDELRIRPVQKKMSNVMKKFAQFSPDFMVEGRGENIEKERESL